jgi:RNA polymerase sigma factor (sigma-70 family)
MHDDRGTPGPDSPSPDSPRPETLTTLTLLARAQAGSEAALDQLCARYRPRLTRWAMGRLPQRARGLLDTEDLVQESLLRTLRNVDGIKAANEGSLQVYLRMVILNRIRDAARRPDLISPLDSGMPENPSGAPSPLEVLIGLDTMEVYERALAALPEADQAAIISRIELGTSYAELALVLDKPTPDAARMAVGRALAKLALAMKRDG